MKHQKHATLLVSYKNGSTARISRQIDGDETADQVWAHAFDWMRIKEMYREPIVLTAGTSKLFLMGQDIQFMQTHEEMFWVEGDENNGQQQETRQRHYLSKNV